MSASSDLSREIFLGEEFVGGVEECKVVASEFEKFMDTLKSEPAIESDGSFTLSEEKALAKMAEFSFASESDHLLRLLQVAHLSQTREVQVKLGRRVDTVTWNFEGELPDLLQTKDGLLVPQQSQDASLSHLLPALRDCLKRQFEWCPGDGSMLRWDGEGLEIVESKGRPNTAHFTCRHSTFVQSLFGGNQRLGKMSALDEIAHFLNFELWIDSMPRARGWPALKHSTTDWFGYYGRSYYMLEGFFEDSEVLPVFPCIAAKYRPENFQLEDSFADFFLFRASGFNLHEHGFFDTDQESLFKAYFGPGNQMEIGCAMATDISLKGKSFIRFWLDGVLSEGRALESPLPGLQVVVSGEGLKTDLSGLRVVQNQALEKRMEAVSACIQTYHQTLWDLREHYLLNLKRTATIYSSQDAFINQYHKDFVRGVAKRLPKPG